MVQIQPINIWHGGALVEVNALGARVNSDNLSSSAEFLYSLMSVNFEKPEEKPIEYIVDSITMDGQAYQDWGKTGDINQEAYSWIASELQLTIV